MVTTKYDSAAIEYVAELRADVEGALSTLLPQGAPATLYEPARYVLAGGGKRLRPVLLLLTAQAFGVSKNVAMPAALAVEVFHNFTLVHDDIMDHADTRRGKPTVHARWDESTAILCGDYLMGLSYDLLARSPADNLGRLFSVYHRMVQRLCEGQALDKAFETRADVTVEEYISMIDRKTAALIEAVFEIGGVLGDVDDAVCSQLAMLGKSVGRAFQIQDDLLDITAAHAKWGKKIGGDLIEGKKTYLLLQAIESSNAPARAFFIEIVKNQGLDEGEIPIARQLLEENGILEDARKAVLYHTTVAEDCLSVFPGSAHAAAIEWLIAEMQERIH